MDFSLNSTNTNSTTIPDLINTSDTTKKKFDSFTISLLLVILFSLLIRSYISFFSGLPWLSSDSYDYMKMAAGILSGNPIAKYPNGLPLLISITTTLFKPEKMQIVIIFFNIASSTLVVWMGAMITQQITKNRLLGIVAALIICLYPNQINYSRYILSEAPTCFLLTLSVFIFLKKKYFLAGLTLFLATLFRSDLLFVFPLIFLISLFFLTKEGKTFRAFYFLGGYALGILLYSILLNTGIVASTNRYNLEILKSINSDSLKEEYRSISNFSQNEQAHPIKTYVNFIFNHPATFIQQRLFALENMWGWPPSPVRSFVAKILITVRLPIFIFGLIGFWKYRKNFEAWILLMPIFALTIMHIITYSSPRYTVSVEPLLICLASLSFIHNKRSQNE